MEWDRQTSNFETIAQLELSIAGIASIVVVLFPTDHQGVKGWLFAWAEV